MGESENDKERESAASKTIKPLDNLFAVADRHDHDVIKDNFGVIIILSCHG